MLYGMKKSTFHKGQEHVILYRLEREGLSESVFEQKEEEMRHIQIQQKNILNK